MSNVTRLPDSMERQWRVFEADLRAALAGTSTTTEEIDYAVGRLKPIYIKAANPAMFTTGDGAPDEIVAGLNAWVRAQVGALMLEVVTRDVLLFRHGVAD